MKTSLLIFLLALSSASPCPAQNDTSLTHPDSLLKAAYRHLSRGSLDSVRSVLKEILSATPENREARICQVQVAIAEREWSDALDVCEDLLEQNPRDAAAHHYAGISERELGTERAGLLRTAAWTRARKHFEAAIAADSLFQDVLYQFARLKEYNEEWPEALALAHRQVQARPDQVDALAGLFHIYRHYLAETDADEALTWLQGRPDDYGRYFAAEVLRRTKRFREAESAYIQLLTHPSPVPVQACYLSLARVYAARNEDVRAQSCYWKAVDNITSWLGAALIFDQIKYIITDGELDRYRLISSDRHKAAFFQKFWRLRDPMPAAPVNYRLVEHMRRLNLAEELYEYYGFRTGFSNPDRANLLKEPEAYYLNKEFNDLGLMFLRQGPPDRIERTMGNMGLGGPNTIDPHQAWLYNSKGNEPQRIFHFALHNTTSNNWRLTPLPGDQRLLDYEMLSNLSTYDLRYFRLQQGNALESLRIINELQQDAEEAVATALTTDRAVWDKKTEVLVLPHSTDAFRSSQGWTLIDVSFAIPHAPLRTAAGSETEKVRVEAGISIVSPDGRMLSSRLDTLELALTRDGTGSYVGLYRQQVLPDSIRLTLHVRALSIDAVGAWTEAIRVPAFTGNGFMLSDLQLLLPASSGPSIEIDGVKVIQSPFQTYSREKPLYTYLQLYNLVKDMSGKADYSVQWVLAPRDDPDETTVLAEAKRQLDDDSRAEFRMLDIKQFDPGLYTLSVLVTDRKRVQTLSRTRPIEITK